MIKDLTDAQKLDILLNFKGKGYNLRDTDDPAVMQMSLGIGYTLFASIKDSWVIEFNDGVEKTRHNIESPKIPFTNAKDALRFWKEYEAECKRVLAEKRGEPVPEQKEPEAEEVDLEEKRRILEALENGEIEKPASRRREPRKSPEEVPPVVDSTPKETPENEEVKTSENTPRKTEKWSKPTSKHSPSKHENLPVPAEVRSKQISDLTIKDVRYLCPLATDQEIFVFLKLCQARGLNPFLNEVYLIKYGNEAAQTVVGKETFTRRAELSSYIDGFEAGIIIRNENKKIEYRTGTFWIPGETILGGWAKVYRTDKKYPYEAQVPYQEFEGKKKDGTVTKFWRTMPATMIRKVALVQALREALPSELSGLYDAAEISSGAIIDADYEEVCA